MAGLPKTSWADDLDELEQPKLRKPEETIDENGIITTIEYSVNDEGKPIKITKRIRRTMQKAIVQHAVAERKNWSKFGQERGNKPGPDRSTTTVGENVVLKLSAGNKLQEQQEQMQEDEIKASLAKAGAGKILCRICKRDHFTSRCPYKSMLGGLEELGGGIETPPFEEEAPAAPASAAPGGKYVPPSMRGGGARPGESMGRPREGLPTIRISNLSKDASDNDVRDLLARVGRPARVHIVSDHVTRLSKGFAFVSFEDRAQCQMAVDILNGVGYDNLILNVSWTEPREPRENRL